MSVHFVSLKGRRNSNEDEHNKIINISGEDKKNAPINYYAIYDGHGGNDVSKFLKDLLPKFFMDTRVKYPLVKSYVKQVFSSVQTILRDKYKKMATQCGSTCLVATHFLCNNKEYVIVLNTGDSRCIIGGKDSAVQITEDHKPNTETESKRIKALGGKPYFDGCDWRIKDLSVSRAFGDLSAEPYVTCEPDIFLHKVKKSDRFMVMACDGLWDVLSNEDVVKFVNMNCYDNDGVRINKNINIARRLGELAILRKSGDNISVFVIFFD